MQHILSRVGVVVTKFSKENRGRLSFVCSEHEHLPVNTGYLWHLARSSNRLVLLHPHES